MMTMATTSLWNKSPTEGNNTGTSSMKLTRTRRMKMLMLMMMAKHTFTCSVTRTMLTTERMTARRRWMAGLWPAHLISMCRPFKWLLSVTTRMCRRVASCCGWHTTPLSPSTQNRHCRCHRVLRRLHYPPPIIRLMSVWYFMLKSFCVFLLFVSDINDRKMISTGKITKPQCQSVYICLNRTCLSICIYESPYLPLCINVSITVYMYLVAYAPLIIRMFSMQIQC